MKKALGITILIIGAWALIVYTGDRTRGRMGGESARVGARGGAGAEEARALVDSWPKQTKGAAMAMIEKYGTPDESGARKLVWNQNGPWSRTVVRRDEIGKAIEQSVELEIPANKFALLDKLPGGVSAERGKNELRAASDNEPLNFLAVNLAQEVFAGKRTIADAAGFYKKTATLAAAGKSSPYVEKLLFKTEASRKDAEKKGAR